MARAEPDLAVAVAAAPSIAPPRSAAPRFVMTFLRRRLAFFPFLLVLTAAVVAWSLPQGEDLLIQRRYREAVAALEAALPLSAVGEQDRVLLLLGEAQWLAGDRKAATETLQRLLQEQAGSGYVPHARYLLAKVHEGDGNLRMAAQIYRDESERLTGFLRKEEVAKVYLELADKAASQDPPDNGRVVTFCDLALDLGLRPERARGIELRAAEAALAGGAHAESVRRLGPLVELLSIDGGKRKAMLLLGRARLAGGERTAARAVLRDLIALGKDAPEAGDAAYEVALTFGVPQPPAAQLDRAVQALEDLRRDWPAHQKARVAQYLAAQCYQGVGRADDALRLLAAFLEAEAGKGGEEIPAARALRGDVLARQGKTDLAIAAWREYLAQHPAHADWERVQRAIVDAEWTLAKRAFDDGKSFYGAARERLDAFARAYPLDHRNPWILLLRGSMCMQEESYEAARAEFARCVSKYPGREESSSAQLTIGEIFETKTFDYEKALEAYRAVTWGSAAAVAQERVARLTQTTVRVRTPRVFRTDEQPGFVLTSRNVESVRVRVFRLDLEDYFRATHQAANVHELDIEVIAADLTFDSAVAGYVRYCETERTVSLPLKEPGAYVVKVDDKRYEATTMVLVSDLALITKSSRHEFLVMTQNTKENRIEAGVKVVLGDAEKVLAEGVTDAQGFFRFRGNELKNCDSLRVFAVAAGGSGASSLDLSGMGYSAGLLPRGYLTTDRPLYQPGHRVHGKGVVREVHDGIYALPQASGYAVQVLSPSGQVVMLRDVAFSPFGTFDFDLDLDAEAELGEWRITVGLAKRSDHQWQTTFHVGRYERPRLQLTIEVAESVVYRGEHIRGTLRAQWFYGQPAQGRDVVVRLQMPDGSVMERRGTTNAAGEVPFELPTEDFAEEAMAVLAAEMPADGVGSGLAVPIATSELDIGVTTPQPVYLAGEPFEVSVVAKDRSGKPLQRELTAVLLALETDPRNGTVAERELERRTVRTTADGAAKTTFTAAKGGQIRVRVQAIDRFAVPVSSEVQLTISGDDDAQRLRLLCGRETFKVGEKAAVRLVNRAGARLALLTWQGDGILACETRVVPSGESTIEMLLQPEHAPNFAFAVAMVDGEQLHTAERPFLVQRDLTIELEAPAVAAPGGKVDLVVRVRDPQGRPLRAEISVAMVDDALLALHGDKAPPIGAYFYGQMRETAFRTQSSCTWSYDGITRAVDEALLSEDARRALPAAEAPTSVALSKSSDGLFGLLPGQDVAAGATAFDSKEWNLAVAFGGGTGSLSAQEREKLAYKLGSGAGAQDEASRARGYASFAGRGVRSVVAGLPFDLGAGGFDDRMVTDLHVGPTLGLVFAGETPVGGVRVDFRETGVWLASLTTGDDGTARATIVVPHSTTSWRLQARAVTADSWVGEGRGQLRSQRDVQVDIQGPPVLTEGDEVAFSARVHNLGAERSSGSMKFRRTMGEKTFEDERAIELSAGGELTVEYPFVAATAGAVELEAGAALGAAVDALKRSILVQPFGVEVVEGRSGSTRDRAALDLSLPADGEFAWMRMVVEVGPDRGRDLLRAAIGGGYQLRNCVQVESTVLARSSRGLSALLVLDYLEHTSALLPLDREQLLAQANAALQGLIGAQLADGSFSWVGKRSQDLRSTSQALRFLSACVRRGLGNAESPRNRAAEALLQASRSAGNDQRADLMWALAVDGRARFEALNALHRTRNSLGADGLARLALAWQAFGRAELANEVLVALQKAMPPTLFQQLSTETVALAARALLTADPRDGLGVAAAAAASSSRCGAGWSTPEATTAAIALAAMQQREGAGAARATEVTVVVNGRELATTPKSAQGLGSVLVVPSEWLQARGNAVQIQVAGGGEAFYSITLVGFRKGFDDKVANDSRVHLQRTYLAAPRRFAGRDVPSGFSVVQGQGYRSFTNEVSRLRVGESALAQTHFAMHDQALALRGSPLVLEEPLPAGCSVPRDSIQGPFDYVEVQPDRLVFYFREGVNLGVVSYQLQARFAGSFRALPSLVYGAMRPELRSFGKVSTLRIDGSQQGEPEAYRLTPDERFYLGRSEFEAAEKATGQERQRASTAAQEHLAALLSEWQKTEYRLRDDVATEVARMMLYLGIERGEQKQVVEYFEQLKDRQPDLVIPFDKILAVGRSYFDLGEFEAALLVFRGTVESSFLKDAAVATTLSERGEHRASSKFLEQLLLAYPDLPTMRTLRYSIAQQLAAMAAEADPLVAVDERMGSIQELRQRSLQQFREFLILYPEDPLAEEVSFAWATTLLEGGDLKGALAVAEAGLQRYPDSSFQDELLYTVGYAQFALGQHDAAFAALERVATESFAMATGGKSESESKWHAVYLQGQIWHARGEPEKALVAYDQVKDRFSDAVEASDYFRHKVLTIDEATTFATDVSAELAIKFRNIARAQVQVFRVDLMRLYLLEKSLNDIRGIQLHGIKPLLSLEIDLGSGRDYKDAIRKVPLDVKEPGAYLCVVRGGDVIATGMVLKSDLRIEAQEQFAEGRMRVNVRRGDAYVHGAHVKMVGSGDGRFRSGDSDLRGVFAGDGLVGTATVLVAQGENYAFYRGSGVHQATRIREPQRQQESELGEGRVEQGQAAGLLPLFDALDNNLNLNASNRGSQVLWLKNEVMNKKQKGVEVYRTK